MNGNTINDKCIFCKIISGEVPSKILYSDEISVAFLDAFPASKGHCLIVPRKHYPTLLDIPETELKALIAIVQKIGSAAMKAAKADGFNVLQNNFPAAGQAIPHLHFHIVPRFKDDGKKLHLGSLKGEEEELKKLESEIKRHL
ncbi:HIT domain protein [uncultured archaeon]|nr:HIT domain protein [uncultured archaeon]